MRTNTRKRPFGTYGTTTESGTPPHKDPSTPLKGTSQVSNWHSFENPSNMRSCGQRLHVFSEQTRLRPFRNIKWPFRVIWILVLITFVALLCVVATGIIINCFKSKVELERIENRLAQAPARILALHVFNKNRIRTSFLNEIKIEPGSKEHQLLIEEFLVGHEKDLREDELSDLMHMKLKLIQKDLMANYSFREEMTHPCADMILVPSDSSESIIETTYSESDIGCQIELDLHEKKALLIDLELYEHDALSMNINDPAGMEILATLPNDCPTKKIHQSIPASPGTKLFLDFKQDLVENLPEGLSQYNPFHNGCNDPLNRPELEYFQPTSKFTTSHCFYNSILGKVLETCNCIPKFVEFAAPNISTNYCHGKALLCANQLIANSTLNSFKSCLLQPCHEVQLSPLPFQTAFPSQNRFSRTWMFCAAILKLARICLGEEKRVLLETSYPDLCSRIRIANNSGQICLESPMEELVDVSALSDLQDTIYEYAKDNLVMVVLEPQLPHPLKQTHWVRGEEKSIEECVFHILLVCVVIFGISLFGIFEFLLVFFSTVCFCPGRKLSRNSQPPSHAPSPELSRSTQDLEEAEDLEE